MRKTVDVKKVREYANTYLASNDDKITGDMRLGVISLLETILHDTGNYYGFNYVAWMNGGYTRWEKDGRPPNNTPYLGNQTKRFYY